MRCLALVLLLGCAALAAPEARGQAIRLAADRTPLASVLQQLASQTRVDIVYAQRLVEGRAVTGRYVGDDPEQALATVLRGSGLRAEQLRPGQYVIVRAYPTPGLEPEAYRGTLRGTVVDAETGEVLPGAHVLLVGLDLGTATNPAGYFALPNLPAGSYRVRVSYIGYRPVVQELAAYPESSELPPVIRLRPQVLSTDSEALVEVSESERTDLLPVPGSDALDVRQAGAVPAFLGESDVFQALEWLPGVGRSGEAGGEMVVRGAEPHFNRYLLDGAPIIHPWHTFGLFSTFQTEALKSVRLYKGSLPAEYGGGLSAVLEVEMKDGDRDDAAGSATLSPVSLRAVSEVPLGKGASLMLSGRRTYLDLLLSSRFRPGTSVFGEGRDASEDQGLGYHFYDLNAKVTLRPSPYHRFSLSLYEGGDALDTAVPLASRLASDAEPSDARLTYDWGNRVVSARYRWLASRRLFVTSTGYYSRYRADEQVLAPSATSASVDSDYRVRFAEAGLTVDADYYYSLEHQVRAGLRLVGRTFESRLGETLLDTLAAGMTGSEQNASVQAVEAVAYLQDTWQPNARWQVQPGLRVEVFGLGPYVSVSPRLNVRYVVARDQLFLKAGVSRQVQYLHRLRDRYSFTYDLAASRWIPASEAVRPAVGWQAAAGLDATPARWLALGLDLYGRFHDGILLPTDAAGEASEVPGALLADYAAGSGRAFGIEASAEAERGAWRLGLSYAFARSQERPLGAVYRRASYDAPHTAKALLQGQIQRWTVSLAATARSGYPVTVPVTELGAQGRAGVNNGRLPVYARVDLAVGYGFRALGLDWDASLQAYNLLNRRNTVGRQADPDASAVQTTQVYGLPILPMGSLKVQW
ncbi:MAG: TonB-dependent receptor [Bacteroidota bacterium]